MAYYDPNDPYNWKGIDLERQGLNAAGGTKYVLPDMGMDPEYIAYLTQYQYGQTQAAADAELRKRQAADAYEQALRSLETQGVQGAQNTDTNLLSRGMFNSGERVTRQEDLRRALTEGRGQADTQYSQTIGAVDSDLQRALTQMDMERERQTVASKARIAEQQRQGSIEAGLYGGGSGSGGGSVATDTPPVPGRTPAQQQSAANQQRAVTYGQTYQNPGGGRGAYGPTASRPQPARPAAVSTSAPGAGRGSTGALTKPKNYPQQTRY